MTLLRVMPLDDTLCELAKCFPRSRDHIVDVRPETVSEGCLQLWCLKAHWRKKAKVSLDTCRVSSDGIPVPLTKCGVAASLPPVSTSSASPVWKAVVVSELDGVQTWAQRRLT